MTRDELANILIRAAKKFDRLHPGGKAGPQALKIDGNDFVNKEIIDLFWDMLIDEIKKRKGQ